MCCIALGFWKSWLCRSKTFAKAWFLLETGIVQKICTDYIISFWFGGFQFYSFFANFSTFECHHGIYIGIHLQKPSQWMNYINLEVQIWKQVFFKCCRPTYAHFLKKREFWIEWWDELYLPIPSFLFEQLTNWLLGEIVVKIWGWPPSFRVDLHHFDQ